MRRFYEIILRFAWGLWLGGLITVFLAVLTLFHHDRSVAVVAAPMIFHAFEPYQCALAGVAVVFSALWGRKGLLTPFLLAGVGAGISVGVITPRITEMQRQGLTHTAEFGKMHGISMMVYTSDAALLVVAGLMLGGWKTETKRRRDEETKWKEIGSS
jgi:uncharacterized protein DUF4149